VRELAAADEHQYMFEWVAEHGVTGVEDVAQRQGLDVPDVPCLKVVTVTFDKMEAHIKIVEEGGKHTARKVEKETPCFLGPKETPC
jgi:hypothetical protein